MASKKMKVSVDADTSGFKKQMAAAKSTTEDFSKTVGQVASEIEGSLGIPVGAIAEIGSKIKNVAGLMKGFSAQGETAFQKIALGASVAAGAIGGIALTGLIAAFKVLNEEAERYRNTVGGTAQTMQTDAWKSTFAQAAGDMSGVGKRTAAQQDIASKWWTKAKTLAGAALSGILFGGTGQGVRNVVQVVTVMKAAEKAAEKAEVYAKEIFDTTEAMKDKTIEWKEGLADVAALMLTASDKSKSVQERQEAVEKAIELQKTISGEQIELQTKLADNIKAQNDLASSSVEDMDRQRSAYAAIKDTSRELNQRLREMTSLQNEIANSAAATAKAWSDKVNKAIETGTAEIAKYSAAMEKASELREKMALDNITAPLPSSMPQGRAEYKSGLSGGANLNEKALQGLQGLGSFDYSAIEEMLSKIDVSKLSDSMQSYYTFLDNMVSATKEANKEVSDAIVDGLSNSFQYLANCLYGLEDFSGAGLMNALLTPLAEAAIKMGEIMVSAGLASEAFKSMLTNPYTAIAAGAALIAVGAAARAGLQAAVNSATGTSYVASSVASSGYSNNSSSDRSWEREMTLHVTGTLQADGSKLVAVLNNEANRKRYTT